MAWKKVSKAEFDSFIVAFPRRLESDVTSICEPPMRTYNDFSDGKVWPESIAAKEILNEAWPNSGPNEYYILSNSCSH